MTLAAGWAAVLSRLSGQPEVVIGTPVAGRTRSELEGLIGFFVNTQALRVAVSGTAAELLEQVKGRALDAQEHQDLPFEQVIELVRPPRSLSHTPIFQVMLAWQNNDEGSLDLPGLSLSPAGPAYGIAKFDLELELSEAGDRIVGGLKYATALFDRRTIERHVGYLRRVLEAMVADERQALDRIDLLGDAERHRLLIEWNDTQVENPQNLCIHELFETQAARTPDATSVVFQGQTLTYAELNRKANQLAHHLIRLGVKPDDRVAICVERGLDMVVGLLSVLKAGGAYVPFDPNYPQDRLTYMLKDSTPLAILTTAAGRAALADPAISTPFIDLQSDAGQWQQCSPGNPRPAGLSPHHLAYIIYTSGSTGAPKGVMIEHRQTVNFLLWAQQSFDYQALSKTLFSTSLNFDLAVYECFAPLTVGGRIEVVENALALRRDTHDIRLINTVPSALQALLEAQAIGGHVDVVNVAGEALKRELVERLFAETGVAKLYNLYGPSETTTYSSWVGMNRETGFLPHIGRPIANTQIYILDAHRQPVPTGAAGELYIGGAGVARGYLNRPELTAERFLADPFAEDPDARMYRTGDVGRFRSDGNIEYLGRNDFQVKIRGFRIELGEIEARLAEHPDVRQAVVLAREDQPGDKRLVAYLTTVEQPDESPADINPEELRARLSVVLPEHMVPAAYVMLAEFPLTPNGKLDRKALPAPDADAYSTREYEAPVGEVENALARIWADVLKLERVGRHDNFFELGGHSLLAVTLISHVHRVLEVAVVVRDLFQFPVVAAFAELVKGAARSEELAIVPASRAEALPLSFAQQRLWFLAQMDRRQRSLSHPARTAPGRTSRSRCPQARFGPHRIAGMKPCAPASSASKSRPCSVSRLRTAALRSRSTICVATWSAAAELDRRMAEEAVAPFDLENGPLIRGQLFRLAERGATCWPLPCTTSCPMAGRWGCSRRAEHAVPAPTARDRKIRCRRWPFSMPTTPLWQRQWLTGEVLAAQSEYWRAHAGGRARVARTADGPARPARQDVCRRRACEWSWTRSWRAA